jgi:homoserine kinase type II
MPTRCALLWHLVPQGRAIAGEDSLESLTSRAASYAKRVRWVNANRDQLVAVIREKMAALVAARA